MLRAPKGNSKGSEKGNYQHSICCASPHFHIKTLKIQTSSYVSTSSLKLWSIFMPVCLKFSQWTRHVIRSVTLSYTRWLYKPKCGFVSPFSQEKTSVSAQELPFKNGLFGFCPYWCPLSCPHYSVVLLNLIEPFLSILRYMENLTFFPILHTQTVLSFSTGFCRGWNYKIERDGENNIYILASSKSFLPAMHPSCCPYEKNSLLGF